MKHYKCDTHVIKLGDYPDLYHCLVCDKYITSEDVEPEEDEIMLEAAPDKGIMFGRGD